MRQRWQEIVMNLKPRNYPTLQAERLKFTEWIKQERNSVRHHMDLSRTKYDLSSSTDIDAALQQIIYKKYLSESGTSVDFVEFSRTPFWKHNLYPISRLANVSSACLLRHRYRCRFFGGNVDLDRIQSFVVSLAALPALNRTSFEDPEGERNYFAFDALFNSTQLTLPLTVRVKLMDHRQHLLAQIFAKFRQESELNSSTIDWSLAYYHDPNGKWLSELKERITLYSLAELQLLEILKYRGWFFSTPQEMNTHLETFKKCMNAAGPLPTIHSGMDESGKKSYTRFRIYISYYSRHQSTCSDGSFSTNIICEGPNMPSPVDGSTFSEEDLLAEAVQFLQDSSEPELAFGDIELMIKSPAANSESNFVVNRIDDYDRFPFLIETLQCSDMDFLVSCNTIASTVASNEQNLNEPISTADAHALYPDAFAHEKRSLANIPVARKRSKQAY